MVHDPLDAGGDVGPVPGALGVHGLGHNQLRVGRHARDAFAVVLGGGDDPAHMGAVALVVLGAARALGLVTVRPDATGRLHDLAGEVLVFEVDAGVDDADPYAGAGAAGPGGF